MNKKILHSFGLLLMLGFIDAAFATPIQDKIRTYEEYIPKDFPKVGETAYVPLARILPGQLRVDQSNIQKKAQEQKTFLESPAGEKVFSEKQSTLTLKQAIPVVKVLEKGKIVFRVIDSHHEVLAAIQNGSQKLPIKVMDDLTRLGDNPITALEDAGYIDLYNPMGIKQDSIRISWGDLATQQDNLRAYITNHVKKIVWGTGEDKTPKVKNEEIILVKADKNPDISLPASEIKLNTQNEEIILVKADKNPDISLPASEIKLNTHLENRLSTALRTLEPTLKIESMDIKAFKELLKKHLEAIKKMYPQFEKVRFILETEKQAISEKLWQYVEKIKSAFN